MIWKPIPSIPGLEISDTAEIRGGVKFRRNNNKTVGPSIVVNERTTLVKVLMAETFLGVKLNNFKINLIDGNLNNVTLDNLEKISMSDICKKGIKKASGRRNVLSNLSHKKMEEIRQMKREGFTQLEIGNINGISVALVRKIINYETK